MDMNDRDFLQWLDTRIIEVYGESRNVDFLHRLRKIYEPMGDNKPKPKIRTTYEKAEFNHAWQAVKAFEDGEELFTREGDENYSQIDSAPDVLRYLYRLCSKVEKEIDWREEVDKFLGKSMSDGKFPFGGVFRIDVDHIFIDGKFQFEGFLEMCRVALRANGEL